MRSKRLSRGKDHEGASFPVPPMMTELPADYLDVFHEIKTAVQQTRLRTILTANAAMVQLYWEIGQSLLLRQGKEGWGAKIVDRLSTDLHDAFPEMRGFSPTNLKYMRRFAEQCPRSNLVSRLLTNCRGSIS